MGTEEKLGVVTDYYTHIGVAVVRLTDGELRIGDQVRVRGRTTDFVQPVDSLQVEHRPVDRAAPGSEVALKVRERARRHDEILRVLAG
jgi:translation elongation factor EF-1alpha